MAGEKLKTIESFMSELRSRNGPHFSFKDLTNAGSRRKVPRLGIYHIQGLVDREKAFDVVRVYLPNLDHPKRTPILALHSAPGGGKTRFLQAICDGEELPDDIREELSHYQPLAIAWNHNSKVFDGDTRFPELDLAVRLLYS